MPAARRPAEGTKPRRRADAERSVARILDAAVDALGEQAEVDQVLLWASGALGAAVAR